MEFSILLRFSRKVSTKNPLVNVAKNISPREANENCWRSFREIIYVWGPRKIDDYVSERQLMNKEINLTHNGLIFYTTYRDNKRKFLFSKLQKAAHAQCGAMVISGPVVRNSEKWKNARTAR